MNCLNKLVKQQIAGVLFYNPVKIFTNDLPVHTKIATNHQIENDRKKLIFRSLTASIHPPIWF